MYLRDRDQRALRSCQVAIGIDPLKSLTTGINNIAIGGAAADALTTGICNIAVGMNSLGASTTGCNNIAIGELVMDGLSQLDPIAYVRFASVYRNFRETKDFEDFIDEIHSDQE